MTSSAAPAAPDFGPIYQAAGQEWNVDPSLLQAVAGQESGGTANPNSALSPAGAQGKMQIMPATGQTLGMTDPNDPVQSIYAGAKYLSQQLDKYGSPELALAAYNAGPGHLDGYTNAQGQHVPGWLQTIGDPRTGAITPQEFASRIPIAETAAYVPGVGQKYAAITASNGNAPAAPSAATAPDPTSPSTQQPPVPRAGGDSLAAGLAQFNGFGGGGVVGANPTTVLANLKNEPQNTTGAPYWLSSGISNAGDKMGSLPVVQQQIDLLHGKGYNDIRLVGTGARADLAPLNGPLSDMAASNGITFAGAVPSGGDQVHPATQAAYRAYATTGQPVPQDGGATSRLNQAVAGLRQSPATPGAPAATAAPTPTDAFSHALQAAQAQTAPSAGTPATPPPVALPTPSPAGPATPPLGGSDPFSVALRSAQAASAPGAAPPPPPTDAFTTALQAAQRVSATPASPSAPGSPPPAQAATQPAATPGQPHAGTGVMGTIGNYAEAAGQSVLDASRALYGAIDYGNRNGPAWLAPDGSLIDRLINPAAAIANLDAERKVYDQSGVGNTWAGTAGKLTGQTVLTLPALGALGAGAAAVGRGVATGADAISPALGTGARAVNSLFAGTAAVPDNAIANAAVRPLSLAANGAAQGATVNLLTGDPNASVENKLLMGAGAGAVLGPVGAAALAGARGGADAAVGLIRPFTASGRGAIADRALAQLAQGGPLAADTTQYVPGVTPTLAQATANPGLAGAERAVAAVRPNPFTAQATSNNEARTGLVEGLTGTPTDIEAAQAARDATAVPAITNPLDNATGPATGQPIVDTIDNILASPAGQRDAVQSALGGIRSKLVTSAPLGDRVTDALAPITDAIANGGHGDAGLWAARDALVAAQNGAAQPASTVARLQATSSPDPAYQALIDQAQQRVGSATSVESDPRQLYGIRSAINDALSPLSARAGSDAQLASSELLAVKAQIDNAIEGVAPGFKSGLAEYAASSRPIDAMRYLQSKGYDSADGTVTLAKVKGVLDDIQKQQALPGARDAKSVPQATVDSLQGLYADLLRQNNSRLGMQPGSNTFQNLATASTLGNFGAPLSWAASGVNRLPVVGNLLTGGIAKAYRAQNEPVMDAVVNRLLNPQAGASVLRTATKLQQAAAPTGVNNLLLGSAINALNSRQR